MRRSPGSGHLYVKSGAYYVRRRTVDGRHPNRRLGKVRTRGEADGLTRAQSERLVVEGARRCGTGGELSRTVGLISTASMTFIRLLFVTK
jgi:hypothetical protein